MKVGVPFPHKSATVTANVAARAPPSPAAPRAGLRLLCPPTLLPRCPPLPAEVRFSPVAGQPPPSPWGRLLPAACPVRCPLWGSRTGEDTRRGAIAPRLDPG